MMENTHQPHAMGALLNKRNDLIKLHNSLFNEMKQVAADLDHIDAAIRVFDPSSDLPKRLKGRVRRKAWEQKGHMQRFILDTLREAPAPLTSRDLANAFIEARKIDADPTVFDILRKRMSAEMTILQSKGLVIADIGNGKLKDWRLTPTNPGK